MIAQSVETELASLESTQVAKQQLVLVRGHSNERQAIPVLRAIGGIGCYSWGIAAGFHRA